eukprot:SAG31_NODE_424_length_15826_cov_4.954664_6_plen_79_part_00
MQSLTRLIQLSSQRVANGHLWCSPLRRLFWSTTVASILTSALHGNFQPDGQLATDLVKFGIRPTFGNGIWQRDCLVQR